MLPISQTTVYKHHRHIMKRRTLLCTGSMRHLHAARLPALMQPADTICLACHVAPTAMRREAAAELAARGASVTLACRNVGAAEAAAAEIRCCCGHLKFTSAQNSDIAALRQHRLVPLNDAATSQPAGVWSTQRKMPCTPCLWLAPASGSPATK